MDKQQLEQLRLAFEATPGNTALFLLLLEGLSQNASWDESMSILNEYALPEDASDEQRLKFNVLAGKITLAAGFPNDALKYLNADEAELLLLKAKAHLALDERELGLKAYHAAIEKNAAMEDTELAKQLSVKVRNIEATEGKPKLRVISNDDTDVIEINRLFVPQQEKVTFKNIGGLDDVKKTIHKKIILPFQKPGLFEKFKKRAGGGILMYGPPGCGKTLLARGTAGECNAEFFNVAISDILDMFIGESERKLHAIFENARQHSPSVLFFDEVEALGGKRQNTRDSTSSKLVSQFLAEMDGFSQNNSGVLVLAATNVPWAVDPAFRRPGRFDRVLFVPPPDHKARIAILEALLADRPTESKLDLKFIANHSSGFSGADLRELIDTASDYAIEASIEAEEEQPISQSFLKQALKEVRPTTIEWLSTAKNYARYANEGGQYDEVLQFLKQHGK